MSQTIDYPETADDFELRPVTEADRDLLDDLYKNSPDGGDIGFAPRFRVDPYVAHTEMMPHVETEGFVAQTPDGDPAGAGFVMLTEARVGGEVRPIASLSGLAVHEQYRGRGLAKRLAARRIEHATATHDEACVTFASIQTGNDPSRAVAETWADSFPYSLARTQLRPLDDQPETAPYTVRAVQEDEYGVLSDHLNDFYSDAELFSPLTAADLRERLAASPIDEPIMEYLVAVEGGELVAGIGKADVHKLMWQEIADLPDELQEADELPPSIPESREIRPTAIGHLWYADGRADAVDALIDSVRARPDAGNRIMFALDPDGPLAEFVDIDDGAVETNIAVRGDVTPVEDTYVTLPT